MGPTWGPPGSSRPQMGPMLAPWTLLSGYIIIHSKLLDSQVPQFCTERWTCLCLGQWSCFYARCAKFSWYGKMSRGSTLWPRNIQQMWESGPCFNMKTIFYSYRIPINELWCFHVGIKGHSGPLFNIKAILFRYKIPIIKMILRIRWSHSRLIPI